MLRVRFRIALAGWVGASCTGFVGIAFVLVGATSALEKKQKERYSADSTGVGAGQYEAWIKRSWAGPTK